MSDKPPDAWREWLRTFRERFIAVQGWTEKDAKLRIHDAWAVVRDGRVHVLAEDSQRPASAVPVFLMLTPGGWKLPIRIVERLTGLVEKAMSSDRSPRDIVLGLLDLANHADGQDDSDEIKRKRHKAAFWTLQLLDACEDEALSGVVEHDVFWQAILSALEAGRWLTILEVYRDLQLLADLIKAQSFQSGRSPDELTQCLEVSFLELLRAERGRPTKPREVAEAAGGVWSPIDDCWQFDELKNLPPVTRIPVGRSAGTIIDEPKTPKQMLAIAYGTHYRELSGHAPSTTNSRMELQAATEALGISGAPMGLGARKPTGV